MSNPWHPQFTRKDVIEIKEKTIFSGYSQMKQFSFKIPLFEGGQSSTIQREVFCRAPAVAVLLIDLEAEKLILVEQFRIGSIESSESPWLLEIVAGVVDEGETPVATAIRETFEEAGCKIQALIPIHDYLPSPGFMNEKVKIFCGKIQAPSTTTIHGLAQDGENIKRHIFSVEEAFQLLDSGKILAAHTLIALLWLKSNYPSLPKLFENNLL